MHFPNVYPSSLLSVKHAIEIKHDFLFCLKRQINEPGCNDLGGGVKVGEALVFLVPKQGGKSNEDRELTTHLKLAQVTESQVTETKTNQVLKLYK